MCSTCCKYHTIAIVKIFLTQNSRAISSQSTPYYKYYPHLCGSNGVDEAGLLKPAIAGSDSNFPARVHNLVDHLSWELILIFTALTSKIELHIVLECLHL